MHISGFNCTHGGKKVISRLFIAIKAYIRRVKNILNSPAGSKAWYDYTAWLLQNDIM